MELFLQCWGGAGYFLSKVFLVRAEFTERDKNWRLAGWISYLAGMPAWVTLFISRQDWIASAIEIASIPAITLGIVLVWKQTVKPNKSFDLGIKIFNFLIITAGTVYSIYIFNGITTFSQVLEIIIMFSVLSGNYLLAKRNPYGWLMFMIALISTSTLMYIQGKPILCAQQLISLIPAIIGFIKIMRKRRKSRNRLV